MKLIEKVFFNEEMWWVGVSTDFPDVQVFEKTKSEAEHSLNTVCAMLEETK